MPIVSDLSGSPRYEGVVKHPFALFGLILCLATSAQADDEDQDRARSALEAGEILPLGTILQMVAGVAPGVPIEVELYRDDGLWVYWLEIRGARGRIVELEMDAATGRILELELEDDEG
jgi:uncharacterized membrane protein YkoI